MNYIAEMRTAPEKWLILGNGFRTCLFKSSISMKDITNKMNLEVPKVINNIEIENIKEIDKYQLKDESIYVYINDLIKKNDNAYNLLKKFSNENYELYIILRLMLEGYNFNQIFDIKPNPKWVDANVINKSINMLEIEDLKIDDDFEKIKNLIQNGRYDKILTTNYDNSVEIFLSKIDMNEVEVIHIHGKLDEEILFWTPDKIIHDYELNFKNAYRVDTFGLSIQSDWVLFRNLIIDNGINNNHLNIYLHNDEDHDNFIMYKNSVKGISNKARIEELFIDNGLNKPLESIELVENADIITESLRENVKEIHEWLDKAFGKFKISSANESINTYRIFLIENEIILFRLWENIINLRRIEKISIIDKKVDLSLIKSKKNFVEIWSLLTTEYDDSSYTVEKISLDYAINKLENHV